MTNKNKTAGETATECPRCRKGATEFKRWYHGDQDDLVCLACAEELEHTDTAYAGTKVSEMPIEKRRIQK